MPTRFVLASMTVALSLLAGCNAASINAHADAEIDEARGAAERSFVYGSCGTSAMATCGLIMVRVSTEAYRTRFRDKFCAHRTDEACEETYRRMVDAALAKQYWAADFGAVARECALHPNTCEDGLAYEKLLLASHNTEIQRRYAEHVDRIETERAAALRADSLATAGVALGTIAALSGARVCRSYPSVFGGVATVCSR